MGGFFLLDKVMKLVGGGSVINGATLSNLNMAHALCILPSRNSILQTVHYLMETAIGAFGSPEKYGHQKNIL